VITRYRLAPGKRLHGDGENAEAAVEVGEPDEQFHAPWEARVRGRTGRVTSHHGAHVLPDANALGEKHYEHLYTVAFEASELWGEAQGLLASHGTSDLGLRTEAWRRAYLNTPHGQPVKLTAADKADE
jgi:hypothetical protein